jgi:hypothetical protein
MLKALRLWTVGILLILLTLSTGCNIVVLHPIRTIDIQEVEAGVPFTPKLDGYFFSDQYVKNVMKAKIKE